MAAGEYIVLGINGDFNRCCRRTHGHAAGCAFNRAARPRQAPVADIPAPVRARIAAFTDQLMLEFTADVRAGRSVPGARMAKPMVQRCHNFASRGCVPGQGCWDVAQPTDGSGGPMRTSASERRFRCARFPCCALPGPRSAELAAQFGALPEVVLWRQGLG